MISLELGRPVAIRDSDYTITVPPTPSASTAQRQFSQDHQGDFPFLSLVRVAEGIFYPISSLRESFLEDLVIRSTDNQLLNCLIHLPLHHYLSTTGVTDPSVIYPVLLLQNARLIMYRHNLTPLAPMTSRYQAIDECSNVAQQTAQFISKFTPKREDTSTSQAPAPWEGYPRAIYVILYMHFFRCALFLVFRGDFTAALVCARASASLGSTSPVSRACRQYLMFFLRYLGHKVPSNPEPRREPDEDLIAYLSADVQRSDASWVFRSSDVSALGQNDPQRVYENTLSLHRIQDETRESSWGSIIELLEKLEENPSKLYSQDEKTGSSISLQPLHQLPPPILASTPVQNPGGTSRMSIADILGRT